MYGRRSNFLTVMIVLGLDSGEESATSWQVSPWLSPERSGATLSISF